MMSKALQATQVLAFVEADCGLPIRKKGLIDIWI